MKLSSNHRRDFSCYLRFKRHCGEDFSPSEVAMMTQGDRSAIECFAAIESHGRVSGGPRQPRLLRAALVGKALLNFHIRMWADGCADAGLIGWGVCLASIEELKTAFPWMPSWVWIAVENQARNKCSAAEAAAYADRKRIMVQ